MGRWEVEFSKVPEGHHPRGTTLSEAHRGNLPLRGVLGGISPRVLRGSAGISEVVEGSDPVHVTFRDPPKPTFGPTFDLLEFSGIFGASRRTMAT